MTVRTIKNVSHDFLPIVGDINEQLMLLSKVRTAVDHTKLLDAAKNNIFLMGKYLQALDAEAQEWGIDKAKL